jgi:cell division protease FtsH
MNRKRILRSWWLWGLLVLFVIFVLPSLLSGGSDYHAVTTSTAIEQIRAGNVTKAVQGDKEQLLQLEL